MVVPLSGMNPFSSSTEDPRVRPRRMSDLAVNCAVYAMHLVVPTNIERGAIAVPLNIRENLRERAVERGLRRGGSSAMHGGYDPLKSPPPGTVLEGSSEREAGRDEKAEKKAAKVEVVEKEPDEEDI